MKSCHGSRASTLLPALVFLIALVCAFPPHIASAQVLYGSVTGNVIDTTRRVIPGAEVSLVNTATNLVLKTVTNQSGHFLIRNVPDGGYVLKVRLAGFKEHLDERVAVSVGDVTRHNVTLQVGEITDQITVRGSVTVLQTDTTDRQTELETKEITDLPLSQYRNYQSLMDMVPGSSPGIFWNSLLDTPERSLRRSFNGTASSANNTRIDGAQSVNIFLPHHTAYVPPSETIDVVNISTNSFDAEKGFAGGAAITVVTKSGTNNFHGSAFWHHENSALAARDFFNFLDQDEDGRADKPAGRRHIWGFTAGGPIIKDKLFFFGGFEVTQQARAATATPTVPTASQRRGDFSQWLPESLGGPCVVAKFNPNRCTVIHDPATVGWGTDPATGKAILVKEPFPENIVPENRMSEAALAMQSLLPEPNLPGLVSNYEISGQEIMNRYNMDAKIDWYRSSDHRVWGKFSWMDATVEDDPVFGAGGGPPIGSSGAGIGFTDTRVYGVGHHWSFSPSFLIDGNLGFTHRDQETFPSDYDLGNFGTEILGIPGTNVAPGQERACMVEGENRCSGMPYFGVDGFSGFGSYKGWNPIFRGERSWTFTHNFSWTRGNHEFRFGYDVVRHRLKHWQPEGGGAGWMGPRGGFVFGRETTDLKTGSRTSQNAWASFLLGIPKTMNKNLQWELMTAKEWQHALYLRDRWQVTPKLTFTLGLRWEYYPLATRDDREMEYIDLQTVVPCGEVDPTNYDGCFQIILGNDIQVSNKLFAPRLGLAYRLSEKDVLRSGYGITNNPRALAGPWRGDYPLRIAALFPSDDPYVPQWSLKEGLPIFVGPETTPEARIPLPSYVSSKTMPPDKITRGYIQSWNLTYERKLPAEIVVSLAYVGTQTTHEMASHNLNWSRPGESIRGGQLYPARKAFTGYWDGWLSSNYHAFQVALNRRFVDGLFLKGAYTWARAIDSIPHFSDPALFHRNRAQADFSRPHMLRVAAIYDLPFGKGRGLLNEVIRGWHLNTVFSVNQSASGFIGSTDSGSLQAMGNSQTADQVKPEVKKLGGIGVGNPYYDPTAFLPPSHVDNPNRRWPANGVCTYQDGRTGNLNECYGNSGRNILRGPAWLNLDLSLFRRFAVSEQVTLEFRSEFFNFTNTPHFFWMEGGLGLNYNRAGSSSFMQIRYTHPSATPRVIRFGLKLVF